MLFFIIRRFLYMGIVLLIVSVIGFIIIQLPPGDFLTTYITQLEMSGEDVDKAQIESLRKQYGLDLPIYAQYFKWIWRMCHGDFGYSFRWNRPVKELLWERLALTVMISLFTFALTYVVGVYIGMYSAIHQYRVDDYVFTVFGFVGLATPNFLLALILMFLFYKYLGLSVVGLFSPEYADAPWGIAKFMDMLIHLPIPVIVIGTSGIAAVQRIMRGCLLDELGKQYVITARAKGLAEKKLLFKYPVRIAINPIISSMGWIFPQIVSGGTLVAIVLSLPTVGPLLLQSLKGQDMYLGGSLVTLVCFLTVTGTFISDILLMLVDPRIRID